MATPCDLLFGCSECEIKCATDFKLAHHTMVGEAPWSLFADKMILNDALTNLCVMEIKIHGLCLNVSYALN